MAPTHNALIRLLPTVDRQQLLARSEPVTLTLSQVLCEGHSPLSHAYFPVSGFVSLVVGVDEHPSLEVGMVGHEGMLGSELLLSTQPMPWRVVTQGAGQCLRVEAEHFRALVAQSLALRTVCQRYLMVRLQQLSRAAACERFHTIGPRLARWLLMSQDRAQADRFPVTHVFLALMLGVRRVGVTAAAGALQRQGLIAYRRGELTVVDRPALERAACSCYRADCATYQQLMPKRPEPSRV
jgi:CRP-like cAMP-binding protein